MMSWTIGRGAMMEVGAYKKSRIQQSRTGVIPYTNRDLFYFEFVCWFIYIFNMCLCVGLFICLCFGLFIFSTCVVLFIFLTCVSNCSYVCVLV